MSLRRHSETIVAPITALGGAVAVVRVSGPRAKEVASEVFSRSLAAAEPRKMVFGRFTHGDEGLALPFDSGGSYTGEDTVELNIHGSPVSVKELVDLCVEAGARFADPGEFTMRAFMNGRIDLTQAEGVRDTVNAETDAQLRQANLLRDGVLRDQVRSVRREVEGILAMVEASTDFSEEIGELDREAAVGRCRGVLESLDGLLGTAVAAHTIREGVTVAIAGLPNAGKSSLLNAVLGSDRAIVTEVPGTTRDTIEERVDIGGLLVRLIDTAGLRETTERVERAGVERTRDAIANADLVWYLYDSQTGWTDEDHDAHRSIRRPTLIVASKCDLAKGEIGLPVSATEGTGLDVLLRDTGALIAPGDATALVNLRHAPLLSAAKRSIELAMETLSQPVPDDLAAVDLRSAVRTLGEVTGETTPPDAIERIFADFCIGK